MTELTALNVRITGDAGDLKAAVGVATGELGRVAQAAGRANAAVTPLTGGMARVGQAMAGARGQIQGTAFQVQDMAVQLAAGTNASIVFAQQGSQILSAFGPVGAVLGALAAVSLPLLSVAFASNSEKAAGLAGAIEDLTAATEAFRVSAEAINLGVDEEEVLIVREVNRLMAELASINEQWQRTDSLGARQRLAEEANAIKATLAPLQAQLDAYRRARDEAQKAKEEADRIKAAADAAAISVGGIGNAAAGAVGQVKSLAGAMWDVAAAAAARLQAERSVSEFQAGGLAAQYAQYGAGRVAGERAAREQGTLYNPPGMGSGVGASGGGGGGGGGVDPLQGELEALQQSLLSQEQIEAESHMRRLETLKSALEQRLLTQQEYAALMEQVERTHQFAMGKETREGISATLTALGGLFEGSKKIGAAIGLANSWLAFTEVLKDPAYAGKPWARFAAAAQALASGLNAVRNIKSASPGGATTGGGGAVSSAAAGGGGGPLQVNLNTFGGGDFIRAADFGMILDKLNKEAGDRGYTILGVPA